MTPAAVTARARRLRAPLLLGLGGLLALDALGGLLIFFARLAAGTTPGAGLHVAAGLGLTVAYGVYQWAHWFRIAPWRSRLDYVLGLIAAITMVLVLGTGVALGVSWWRAREAGTAAAYAGWVSAAHNVMGMFVLTFGLAHLGAVLQRDGRARDRDGPA